MRPTRHILVIEDNLSLAESLQRLLQDEGFGVTLASRGDEGLARAQERSFDTVLTDLRLKGLDGLELVKALHTAQPRLPIILMTAHGTTETAIQATRLGAFDYVVKPFDMRSLVELVEKAADCKRLMSEPVALGPTPAARDAIVGNSPAMMAIYKEIGRVAATPMTVLVRGETGTGKELVARAIYQHSDRASQPFIAVSCAAIPETLLESELFGHERGAFTGADSRRIGRFEQAHQGTVFLDEIGELNPSTQSKLLRVLQEKTIQRLGGRETIAVDIRVVAATHRNLEEAIQRNQFREDLYYRLSVVVLRLPALRERAGDIPDLVNYFLHRHAEDVGGPVPSVQPDAMEFLQHQSWPGNIRELENTVRRAALLARGYAINHDHASQALKGFRLGHKKDRTGAADWIAESLARARRGETEQVRAQVLEAVERELFAQAIELAEWNQSKAARWLGVSRLTMREKLAHFGLHHGPADKETDHSSREV